MSSDSGLVVSKTDTDEAVADTKPARSSDKSRARTKEKGKRSVPDVVEIELHHGRWRHFAWALGNLLFGILFLAFLGVVGKWLGVVLLLVGINKARRFVATLLKPAGTIRVTAAKVDLPRGLCKGAEHSVALEDVRHAFFLRRSVPWFAAAPVLVVETGTDDQFIYPRDWFASDSDQRKVSFAINRHLGRL